MPIHCGYTMKCVGNRRGRRRAQVLVVLEARPGARHPVPALALGRQPDDVERRALAEVRDRAGVVDADARVRAQRLPRPSPERDLLAIDPARGLRDVLDHPVELRRQEAHEAAANETRDDAPARADRARHVPREPRDAREADEPSRGERPEVAQAVPEERVVEARREHRQRHEQHGGGSPSRSRSRPEHGDRRQARHRDRRPAVRQELRRVLVAVEQRADEEPDVPLDRRDQRRAGVVRVARQQLHDRRVAPGRAGERPEQEGRREHGAACRQRERSRTPTRAPRGNVASVAATKRAVTAPSGRKRRHDPRERRSAPRRAGSIAPRAPPPTTRLPVARRARWPTRRARPPSRSPRTRRTRRTRSSSPRRRPPPRDLRGASVSAWASQASPPSAANESAHAAHTIASSRNADRPERGEHGGPEHARRAARHGRAGLESQRVARGHARARTGNGCTRRRGRLRRGRPWPSTAPIVRCATSATATTRGPYARARAFQTSHGAAGRARGRARPDGRRRDPPWSSPPFPVRFEVKA